MPKLKSVSVQYNSTEIYVILTTLITIYLTNTTEVSIKHAALFLRYESLKNVSSRTEMPVQEIGFPLYSQQPTK